MSSLDAALCFSKLCGNTTVKSSLRSARRAPLPPFQAGTRQPTTTTTKTRNVYVYTFNLGSRGQSSQHRFMPSPFTRSPASRRSDNKFFQSPIMPRICTLHLSTIQRKHRTSFILLQDLQTITKEKSDPSCGDIWPISNHMKFVS